MPYSKEMSQAAEISPRIGFKDGDNYVIRQSWLNQSIGIGVVLVLLGMTTYVTLAFPGYTTVPLELGSSIFAFPFLNIIPLCVLGRLAFLVYNERLVLTPEYLIHVTGRLAWRARSSRLEYDRIQEIEISQTILQRILGVGDVKVLPLAGLAENALAMNGLLHPRAVKDLIRAMSKQPV
jgi:hypothetical protein